MSFEKIIGNQKAKEILNKSIQTNNILHSYLFVGIDGVGKSLFASEFAKMILCDGNNKPCNTCKSCIEFDNYNHPDFMIVNNEEKIIKIEQIRYLVQKIYERPITSTKKVYIINNSDTMTKEAQNCLLKTLEEPPEYATLILIASNENKLLNTIRSRCIKVNFNKLDDKEIKQYMQDENIKEITSNLISFCDGSIGKLTKIKDNEDDYLKIEELMNKIDTEDLVYILNNSEILYKSKEKIYDLLDYTNILLLKTKEISKLNCIKYVEKAKRRLLLNSNYDMTIDNLLMEIYEEINR